MKHIFKSFSIPLIFLKEGDYYIAYTPAFKLSTCGKTFKQAQKRFIEAIDIFIKEVERKGTLKEVLLECGWTKTHKRLQPPEYISSSFQEIKLQLSA